MSSRSRNTAPYYLGEISWAITLQNKDPPILFHTAVFLCLSKIMGLIRVYINTLRPRQRGLRFPVDIFIAIFVYKDYCGLNNILLKFVPKDPMNNIPALVHIMAWRRSGDMPSSEPMMAKCDDTYLRNPASRS